MDLSTPSLVAAVLAGRAVRQQVFAVSPEIAHVDGMIVVVRLRGGGGELQLMTQGEHLLVLGVDRTATWVLKGGQRIKLGDLSKGLRVSIRYAIRRGRGVAESITIMDQSIQSRAEGSAPSSVIRRMLACMTRNGQWGSRFRRAGWREADGWAVRRELV